MRVVPSETAFVLRPRRPVQHPDRGIECELVLEAEHTRLASDRACPALIKALLKVEALKAGWGEHEIDQAVDRLPALARAQRQPV